MKMKKSVVLLVTFFLFVILSGCGIQKGEVILNYGEAEKVELKKDYPAVVWESGDTNIADVTAGSIQGKGPGSTVVKATVDGKTVAEFNVTVNMVEITGLFLDQQKVELDADGSTQVKYSLVPDDASDYGITWKSINTDIATVDQEGNITAVSPGTTSVICSTKSGILATCEVVVKAPAAKELLNKHEKGLFEYMVNDMLTSFYNPSAVRIRNIYGSKDLLDTMYTIEIQGTNRLGGTLFKQYLISISKGKYSNLDMSDYFNYKATPISTSVMDYSKINNALEEYWAEKGM